MAYTGFFAGPQGLAQVLDDGTLYAVSGNVPSEAMRNLGFCVPGRSYSRNPAASYDKALALPGDTKRMKCYNCDTYNVLHRLDVYNTWRCTRGDCTERTKKHQSEFRQLNVLEDKPAARRSTHEKTPRQRLAELEERNLERQRQRETRARRREQEEEEKRLLAQKKVDRAAEIQHERQLRQLEIEERQLDLETRRLEILERQSALEARHNFLDRRHRRHRHSQVDVSPNGWGSDPEDDMRRPEAWYSALPSVSRHAGSEREEDSRSVHLDAMRTDVPPTRPMYWMHTDVEEAHRSPSHLRPATPPTRLGHADESALDLLCAPKKKTMRRRRRQTVAAAVPSMVPSEVSRDKGDVPPAAFNPEANAFLPRHIPLSRPMVSTDPGTATHSDV